MSERTIVAACARVGLAVCAVAATALLESCSSYQGKRFSDGFDAAGPQHYVEPRGIPYYLSKPQFLLSVAQPAASTATSGATTAASAAPTATVSYNMVQDRSEAYWVTLNPGLLSTPTFKLVFNTPGGTLNSVSSTASEQVTPTITAVGQFIVGVVGAAATFHPDDTDPTKTLRGRLEAALTNPPPECSKRWDYIAAAPSPSAANADWSAAMTVAQGLSFRVKGYSSDSDFKGSFIYLTDLERSCLDMIRKQSNDPDLPDQLTTIINIKPDRWRALYVNYIDSELQRIGRLELLQPDLASSRRQSIEAYRQWLQTSEADAIGAHDLFERSVALRTFLDSVKYKDVHGGTAPAAAEYVQYRTEFDALTTQISALKTTTLAVLKAKPTPVTPYVNTPICAITDDSDQGGRTFTAAEVTKACGGHPHYVVVLDPQ